MSQLIFGEGKSSELERILGAYSDPILVLTGDSSYARSGAADVVERALAPRRWTRHIVREMLPGVASVNAALSTCHGEPPTVIVAVGGGVVIDTAKLVALSLTNPAMDVITGPTIAKDALDVIAIPTTAGSGSERTPFAVAYVGQEKHSVFHPSLSPRLALVDPLLTHSMTAALTASSGLDAIAHAIESAWAVSATPQSLELSLAALGHAWPAIDTAVLAPTPETRYAMSLAATTAGEAIAIAKTTAAHALSYHLTVVHGVPHGVAAALTLGPLLVFNASLDERSTAEGADPDRVKQSISRACDVLGVQDPAEACQSIRGKMTSLGVPNRLVEIGVTGEAEMEAIAMSVNQVRLANNPRRASHKQLLEILAEVA